MYEQDSFPSAADLSAGSDAYATYGAAVGWKTHDGKPMPPWFSLGPTVQGGWISVGREQNKAVQAQRDRCPDLVCALLCEYADGISPERLAELAEAMKERYSHG